MADKLNQFKGTILENGYGMLPKFAMRDAKLKVGPKALYGYLITWGNESFPGRDLICHDLNINEKTFTIYLAELKQRGYITVEQVKEAGRFSHNIYTIEHDLEKIRAIHREIETKEEQAVLPHTEKRNTVKKTSHRVPNNGTPNFGVPKNGAVIIQLSNSTSFNNTTTNRSAVALSPSALETDAERELAVEMVTIGINVTTACKYISQYGFESVKAQLDNLKKAIREGNRPGKKAVTNPGGWMTTALQEHFTDNEVEYDAVKAAQKVKAQEVSQKLEEVAQAQLVAETGNVKIDPQSPFAQIVKRLGLSLQA